MQIDWTDNKLRNRFGTHDLDEIRRYVRSVVPDLVDEYVTKRYMHEDKIKVDVDWRTLMSHHVITSILIDYGRNK